MFFLIIMALLDIYCGYTQSANDNRLKIIFTNLAHADFWSDKDAYYKNEKHIFEQPETVQIIKHLIRDFSIKILFDLGCGDCSALRANLFPTLTRYVGFDIVDSVIAQNSRRTIGQRYYFVGCDLTSQRLPKADLILCRDLLVHLPFKHIAHILFHIKQSSSTYILMTTYPHVLENKDLPHINGRLRQLNMQKPPFNFPPPDRLIKEQSKHQKYLGFWKLKDITIT